MQLRRIKIGSQWYEARLAIQTKFPVFEIVPDQLKEAATNLLQDYSDAYFSSLIIQEIENRNEFDCLYFFGGEVPCVLRFSVPSEHSVIVSLSKITKAASFYEREAREMFGIQFAGLANQENLLLPPGTNDYPMRIDCSGGGS